MAAEVVLDQQLHGLAELLEFQWLAEEGEDSGLLGLSGFFAVGSTGHEDGRQGADLPDRLEHLQAVGAVGQVEVEDGKVERVLLGQPDSVRAASCGGDGPAVVGQEVVQTDP